LSLKEPAIDQEEYDVNALEFTEEFNKSMKETLQRLGTDPTNKSINLNEGLLSVLNNFTGKDANLTEDELGKIKMFVWSLKTVQNKCRLKLQRRIVTRLSTYYILLKAKSKMRNSIQFLRS
jgi:hypothetical protein